MSVISEARVSANRRNAMKSTGPRTPAGKARVALNAVRHSLTATRATSVDESPGAFEAVRRQLVDEWRPATVLEIALVDQIAELLWRRRRVAAVEVALLESNETQRMYCPGDMKDPPDITRMLFKEMRNKTGGVMNVQVYQMRIDRALHRALAELRRLQIDRRQRDLEPVEEFESFDLNAPETPQAETAQEDEPHDENEKTNPPAKMTVEEKTDVQEEVKVDVETSDAAQKDEAVAREGASDPAPSEGGSESLAPSREATKAPETPQNPGVKIVPRGPSGHPLPHLSLLRMRGREPDNGRRGR